MNSIIQDFRYALRTLCKQPGFTAGIVLTLALGIGANTAIFSVVDAVVLRPLPFEQAGELVMALDTQAGEDFSSGTTSYPNFTDLRDQSQTLEEVAIFRRTGATLMGATAPERVEVARVSAGFFAVLRVQPLLGRFFRQEDDLPGAENVALLSNALWQRRFGGDRRVLGKALTLDGAAFTIVGVVPATFSFPVDLLETEVWTPTALDEGFLSNRDVHVASVVGRLKPGATLAQAQVDIDTIAGRLEQQYPESNRGRGVRLVPLHEHVVGEVRPAAFLLLGAVGLVLLIACANVANLLLARTAQREHELGIRIALGAGRARMIRLLLVESGLLAGIGGMLGLLLALWGTDALAAMVPGETPRTDQIGIDLRVLVFTLAVSTAAGLFSGLAPALGTARLSLFATLGGGTRVSGHPLRRRLWRSLVVCEVALAFVLLIGAGLMIRSFDRLMRVDCGFESDSVLTFQMSIPFSSYSDPVPRAELYRKVVDRLASLPGVKSAGATAALPLGPTSIGLAFDVAGRPEAPSGEEYTARSSSVTPDYFRTMGIALRNGRFFTDSDRRDAPGVAIINETMARQYWPNENPLGQVIMPSAQLGDNDPQSYEIVGIVSDVRARAVDVAARPSMYFPFEQQTWPFMSFALRTAGDPLDLVGAVRHEIAGITNQEAAFRFNRMDQYVSDSTEGRRFPMLLLAVFAGLAVTLAATGIYAMLSYSVSRRTHEIGVRMAIGAQKANILCFIVRYGLTLTAIGLGAGLAAALAAGRLLASQLYEISALDPITFVVMSLLLGFVALIACYIPARRATKVDPMVALRYE